MARPEILANGHSGMLDRPVGVNQFASHHSNLGTSLDVLNHCVEPARERDRVVVEEDEVLAPSGGGSVIAGGRKPLVAGMRHNTDLIPITRQQGLGAVPRSVVGYDDLERALRPLFEDTVQALARQVRLVVDRDDNGTPCHVFLPAQGGGMASITTYRGAGQANYAPDYRVVWAECGLDPRCASGGDIH